MNKLTDASAFPRASAVCELAPPFGCWEDGSVNRGTVEKKNIFKGYKSNLVRQTSGHSDLTL